MSRLANLQLTLASALPKCMIPLSLNLLKLTFKLVNVQLTQIRVKKIL